MEEGSKSKKTVFVGGLAESVDESSLYEHFSTFGDIIEVQLPPANNNPNQPPDGKHRGFAFVTFGTAADAQDAIDNMDLNELNGKVIKVNLARPNKGAIQAGGYRAIWDTEEWLQTNIKPLSQSGGVQGRNAKKAEEETAMDDEEE